MLASREGVRTGQKFGKKAAMPGGGGAFQANLCEGHEARQSSLKPRDHKSVKEEGEVEPCLFWFQSTANGEEEEEAGSSLKYY